MEPVVRFRLPDGAVVPARPGSHVGRAWSADVSIDDGRVSEAHAYVSLRDGALQLLALRGRVRCGGRDTPRLALAAGMRVELAQGVVLDVVDVRLGTTLLALEAAELSRQVLVGVTSVVTEPALHLARGASPSAAALVWSDGLGWRLRVGDGPVTPLAPGRSFDVGRHTLHAVVVEASTGGIRETMPRARPGERLRIITTFESVQIWRDGDAEPTLIAGVGARLLSELLAVGGPLRWDVLAAELWRDGGTPAQLRHRLDVTLARLRRQLDAGGIRRDLVTSHRNGWIELLLFPGDHADDRS